jgi:lipopolysaccharide/colanic/teichoic acid biosynthesis glycosyltransferase
MNFSSNPTQNLTEDMSEAAVNVGAESNSTAAFFSEGQFRRMLSRERKRSERSRKHLVLMLIDDKTSKRRKANNALLSQIAEVVCRTMRDTDLAGWFKSNSVLGVIFTELGETEIRTAVRIIESKVSTALNQAFKPSQLGKLQISFYAFPEGWVSGGDLKPADPTLYPDLLEIENQRILPLMVKRGMDVLGSLLALLVLAPVFFVLALFVKLTSVGPVFFRQQRVGQYGVAFTFLKFRSMFTSTNAAIHQEYVKNYIAGKAEQAPADGEQKTIYKIMNDPRVTWIGKFMRRTSLDELPQFWNVLTGEMSLVGPRPPIPYEIEAYDIWHRRRLLEAKPGITGLWQVHGRSRTTFDEMVRLDLQYSRIWTPMLDVKILLQTPRAVLSGDGAY